MKKFGLNKMTLFAIAFLFIGLALLPLLKASAPQYFPTEGFRDDISCREAGITCPEGNFCQNKRCIRLYPGGPVPEGDM